MESSASSFNPVGVLMIDGNLNLEPEFLEASSPLYRLTARRLPILGLIVVFCFRSLS